jgi:enterobactin C-glucosyltransferase
MIAGLVEFARYWRPDLIIWEPTTYAGSIAAKATGVAHARLLYCLDVYGVTREHYLRLRRNRGPGEDPMAEWLGGYARRYGAEFSEDMVTGQFTIDQLPAPLRLATGLPCLPMRYVPYGGPATVPDWLWAQPERPRVALTLGLSATERYSGYAVSVASLLAALSDMDIELVATIAEDERKKLPRIPDNTRVVPYVPWHHLAPTCAAVIHHAGAATLATASLHGLPQLALPFHFDQPALAARLAEQGAGLTLSPDEADGQAVREQLLRLLTEPSFRAAAEKLRADMHTTPTPNQVVPRIEEFVARHRRQ